jgi:CRP-like cAMP-binding protein/rhodanese-related sulfurtransferase
MGKYTKKESIESTIFGQLSKEKWDDLTAALEHQVVAPGTIIFSQGDPGDKYYIIQAGKVRLFRKDRGGLETVFSILGAGKGFGEMALLTGEARSVNVEAMEETYLIVLSKEQFEERILKDFPEITLAFVKQMSKRLLRDEKIIAKGAQKRQRARQQTRRLSWLDFVLLIGVSVILAFVFNRSNPNGIPLFPNLPDRKAILQISAVQAVEAVKKGDTVIVDAGPEGFYQSKHIQGAISVPLALSDVLYEVIFGEEVKGKKLIVYGGTFSKLYDWELADKLFLKGHKEVKVLDGGIAAWEKAGYPVEKWEEKK